MRLGKDLLDKPIISITDGRSLGEVKDVYVSSDLSAITGIYTGYEGLIKRKHFLIPRASVVVFGIDAILVMNPDVIVVEQDQPEADTWLRLSKLRGREVDTPGGTKVATIGDVILGERGDITGFALSRVFVEGPVAQNGRIPRNAVVDTGSEDGVMTIDLTAAENPQPDAGPKAGDLPEKAPIPDIQEQDNES